MVLVPKPNGKIRICVDLSRLNDSVKRENFPLPRIDQSLGLLAGAKWFSKIDLNLGFWQTRLSDESELLTTFITPFGRFAFNRLVMGLSSSSEYFQKRMTQLEESIAGVFARQMIFSYLVEQRLSMTKGCMKCSRGCMKQI